MLSEEYNENRQAEVKKNKILNLRVSYPLELTNKLNTALHFVINKIEFSPQEEFTFIPGLENSTLFDINGNRLVVDLQILKAPTNTANIIFHTDDCLRDYHKYIMSGVEFINRPEYILAGLQVRFIDDKDNCYTMLEDRTYNESL